MSGRKKGKVKKRENRREKEKNKISEGKVICNPNSHFTHKNSYFTHKTSYFTTYKKEKKSRIEPKIVSLSPVTLHPNSHSYTGLRGLGLRNCPSKPIHFTSQSFCTLASVSTSLSLRDMSLKIRPSLLLREVNPSHQRGTQGGSLFLAFHRQPPPSTSSPFKETEAPHS